MASSSAACAWSWALPCCPSLPCMKAGSPRSRCGRPPSTLCPLRGQAAAAPAAADAGCGEHAMPAASCLTSCCRAVRRTAPTACSRERKFGGARGGGGHARPQHAGQSHHSHHSSTQQCPPHAHFRSSMALPRPTTMRRRAQSRSNSIRMKRRSVTTSPARASMNAAAAGSCFACWAWSTAPHPPSTMHTSCRSTPPVAMVVLKSLQLGWLCGPSLPAVDAVRAVRRR
jgi:hypothetical protein